MNWYPINGLSAQIKHAWENSRTFKVPCVLELFPYQSWQEHWSHWIYPEVFYQTLKTPANFELHTNIFPLKIFMKQIPHKHTHKLSSPLCKTALAGLFPASDSLLRCWWDSARHSTSVKRAFRAMAGWVGSWVMLRYAARRSCSSITRACSSNWERKILDLEMCKTKSDR